MADNLNLDNTSLDSSQPALSITETEVEVVDAGAGGSETALAECSICREVPEKNQAATVEVCGHTFCAGCIVSWGGVSGMCALCRAPFTCLLVNRNLDGTARDSATSEPVTLLRRAAWVNSVSITPDIDTFAPPPADINPPHPPAAPGRRAYTPSPSSAPYYTSEDVEDILEDLFWAEEAKNFGNFGNGWEDNNTRRRLVGNRPFGSNGFMASGRRSARPNTRRQAAAARSAAAGASSSSRSAPQASSPAGRKKKVKKNSRAGKAAAAAKLRTESANASNGGDASAPGTSGSTDGVGETR